jgi:hypothetical protein
LIRQLSESSEMLPLYTVYCMSEDISEGVPFFNSVSHVWVSGAKTTGAIAKKFVFS